MDDKLHNITLGIAWAIAGVVLILVLFGCSPCKHCTSTPLVDTLIIEKTDTIILRDTTLMYQPQDSTASNVVADTEKSHLETDLATSDAWVEGGQLHHNLSNKQDLIPIQVQMPMAISTEKHYLIRIVHKKVNELSAMQNFWIILGKFFAIVIGIGLLLWLIKRRL